jgi:hypothetical protein
VRLPGYLPGLGSLRNNSAEILRFASGFGGFVATRLGTLVGLTRASR